MASNTNVTPTSQVIAETWAEASVAITLVTLRILTQARLAGFRNLHKDDYLMLVAMSLFLVMAGMAHVVSTHGDNSNLTEEWRININPAEAARKVIGSKCFVVSHVTYTGTIWTMKLCMVYFFERITRGLPAAHFIKPVLALVIGTWLVEFLVIMCTCRPFNKNWQLNPNPGPICNHESVLWYLVQVVLNVLTDAIIICIPMPMILAAKISFYKKVHLVVLLGASVFVMVAAILRVMFVFKNADPATPAIWGVRECVVAIFVTNAPQIRPLFTKKMWRGGYEDNELTHTYPGGSVELGSRAYSSAQHSYKNEYGSSKKADTDTSSTEQIIRQPEPIADVPDFAPQYGILVKQTIDIESVEDTFGENKRRGTEFGERNV
ncbi:hypothetical protein MPH_01935 [Macrophomina phaseolina MS6]|uniref:Rhodopsin domain-containing protein n=2 Tax=Macrophomina phaseolina TaxID=35725 RepID=K2S190_MACPH|nr:hypothetical protein MPH_01935 [Macrophomina phaseolina MS6]KAH7050306.1 hypothetical protein B0J12DRAFT_663897 [Macrophomina phaseolina]